MIKGDTVLLDGWLKVEIESISEYRAIVTIRGGSVSISNHRLAPLIK